MKKLLLEFKSNKRIPSASKLDNRVEQDLKLLKKRQHSSSGGSGFWNVKEEDDISVFISVYVAHCLTCCQERGFSIDVILKRKVTEFLSDSNIISWCQRLHCTNPTTLTFIRAFALYMRQRLTPSKLDVVVEQVEAVLADAAQEKKRKPKTKNFHAVSLECLGLLLTAIASIAEGNQLPSLASDIKAYILNNVTETAETAHFVTKYDNDDGVRLLLHSNFRTDAICLESLMTVDPSNTLIPKIVKGLLADRREGHWSSTQADCWVLLSLIRYFEKYEAVVPDFEAELWLGDTFVGEQAFRNRSTEQHQFEVPMSYLHSLATANEEKKGETEKNKKKQAKEQEKGKEKEKEKEKDKETAEVKDKDNDKKEKKEKRAEEGEEASPKKVDLILAKQGEGRLYYRLGLNYSPTCCVLPPIDRGFSVRREFECVDDVGDLLVKEDTSLSSPSSRTIFVKAGKRIRIRVTFTNSVTKEWKRLPLCFGKANTTIHMSPGPPPSVPLQFLQQKSRKCTRHKSLAAAFPTGWSS
ncbi:Ras GTPase domain-containing protein [Balamuthia mandrillaris]